MINLRKVSSSDAKQICEIYNYYIINSIATFDQQVKEESFFASKISEITKTYPWFVAELDGEIVGFCYASPWKDKDAYKRSVEVTVYIKNQTKGMGVGSSLYSALVDELKNTGYRSLMGVISLPNDESIALHQKFNFKKVAHFEKIGFKFGKEIDVACYQLLI